MSSAKKQPGWEDIRNVLDEKLGKSAKTLMECFPTVNCSEFNASYQAMGSLIAAMNQLGFAPSMEQIEVDGADAPYFEWNALFYKGSTIYKASSWQESLPNAVAEAAYFALIEELEAY